MKFRKNCGMCHGSGIAEEDKDATQKNGGVRTIPYGIDCACGKEENKQTRNKK